MRVEEYVAAGNEERERLLEGLSDEELLAFGVALYNAGEFWHAHEAWEQVWMDAPNAERGFYQGLIQVAAAFVHLMRDEYPGTVSLLREGTAKLERYGVEHKGVEVGRLVEEARAVGERVVEL